MFEIFVCVETEIQLLILKQINISAKMNSHKTFNSISWNCKHKNYWQNSACLQCRLLLLKLSEINNLPKKDFRTSISILN